MPENRDAARMSARGLEEGSLVPERVVVLIRLKNLVPVAPTHGLNLREPLARHRNYHADRVGGVVHRR